MIRVIRVFFALLCGVAVLAACERGTDSADSAAAGTPHGTILAMSTALQSNDMVTFLRHGLSESDFVAARAEWDQARVGAIDAADEAELNATLARIEDDATVERVMAQIEPALEEARKNLPLMLLLAQSWSHATIAANESLSEAQKQSANDLLAALGKWAGGKDLADPALARKALHAGVAGARRLELNKVDDIKALEFEEMVGRAGILLAASKDMLVVYGISIDEMLASVSAETLREQGDTALVRVHFELLDTEQYFDVVMVRSQGRWVPEGMTSPLDGQKDEQETPT